MEQKMKNTKKPTKKQLEYWKKYNAKRFKRFVKIDKSLKIFGYRISIKIVKIPNWQR